MLRVLNFEPNTVPTHKGHLSQIHKDYVAAGLGGFALDDIPQQRLGQVLYTVSIAPDTDEGVSSQPLSIVHVDGTVSLPPTDGPHYAIYTDGSKMDNAKASGTGCGLAFFPTPIPLSLVVQPAIHTKSVCLCHTFTVFQAEISAIIEDYHRLVQDGSLPRAQAITIFSDSQSALQALRATYVSSKLVLHCIRLLNAVATITPISLKWVKAHVGVPGNELADSLVPFGPVPYTFVRSVMRQETIDTWNGEWLANPACRQTKLWFPEVNLEKSRKIISLDRERLGPFIRWITGHNYLRRHQNLLEPDIYTSRTCRLCHQEPETAEHLIADCVFLDPTRRNFFNRPHLSKPYEWTFEEMSTFLSCIAEQMEQDGEMSSARIIGPNNEDMEIFIDSIIPNDFASGPRSVDPPSDDEGQPDFL